MVETRRGVSPVIATVILVAVAITISVAVAYWMGGVSSSYTKFEKVEINPAVCVYVEGTPPYWNVTFTVKNTGTQQANIVQVYLNNIEVDGYSTSIPESNKAVCSINPSGLLLQSGSTGNIYILIRAPDTSGGGYRTLSSGTTVNIRLHSANGMDYTKMFELT
jgi:flagellin-like protein